MKKGFTLIELLGVLVILGILSLIVTPSIINVIKNSKEKALDAQIVLVVEASKKWGAENSNLLSTVDNSVYKLQLSELRQSSYLQDSSIINPVTGEELIGCIFITFNEENNGYNYSFETNGCN